MCKELDQDSCSSKTSHWRSHLLWKLYFSLIRTVDVVFVKVAFFHFKRRYGKERLKSAGQQNISQSFCVKTKKYESKNNAKLPIKEYD